MRWKAAESIYLKLDFVAYKLSKRKCSKIPFLCQDIFLIGMLHSCNPHILFMQQALIGCLLLFSLLSVCTIHFIIWYHPLYHQLSRWVPCSTAWENLAQLVFWLNSRRETYTDVSNLEITVAYYLEITVGTCYLHLVLQISM